MRLLQISAWNDSGGGFTHRLLDGHPDLRAWPFELLLGRDGIDVDRFGDAWFRGRFRWPRLQQACAAHDGAALFDMIADTELKDVLTDPGSAKHRAYPLDISLTRWREMTARAWSEDGRFTQAAFIEAYVETFFRLDGAGDDRRVLAHCPISILDAPEILADVPDTLFVCVLRSPLSGYADMQARHPGLEPAAYATKWSLVNGVSALWAGKLPERFRIVTLRDLLLRREAALREICAFASLNFDAVVLEPSWRGRPLHEEAMGPFGGVTALSLDRERRLVAQLPSEVRDIISTGTEAVAAILASLDVNVDFGADPSVERSVRLR